MSTKIRAANLLGLPALPVFAIDAKGHETRYFGRIVYSPRHHLDALGRPIPAKRTREGYEPQISPTTHLPGSQPIPRKKAA